MIKFDKIRVWLKLSRLIQESIFQYFQTEAKKNLHKNIFQIDVKINVKINAQIF